MLDSGRSRPQSKSSERKAPGPPPATQTPRGHSIPCSAPGREPEAKGGQWGPLPRAVVSPRSEGEKKCEREQKGVQGGVETGRQGRGTAQEAGLIRWHCGALGIRDFRERMLSGIHVTR